MYILSSDFIFFFGTQYPFVIMLAGGNTKCILSCRKMMLNVQYLRSLMYKSYLELETK